MLRSLTLVRMTQGKFTTFEDKVPVKLAIPAGQCLPKYQ